MIKKDELTNNESCINKALDHEMVFVLLGRDESAANAVRYWAQTRVHLRKNKNSDPEIQEAMKAADTMDAERAAIRKELGKE